MKKFLCILCAALLLSILALAAGAAELPTVTAPEKMYISYGYSNANAGTSVDAPKATLADNSAGTGVISCLPNGGTIVAAPGKFYIGGNYTMPALGGALKITSNDGVQNYQNPDPATNPACAFKMKENAALTLQSDVIFDEIILFEEFSTSNVIRVKNNATLVIGRDVVCMAKSDVYLSIEVEAGSTVILNGGTFERVTGEGTIINNGAIIRSQPGENPDSPTVFLSYMDGSDSNPGSAANTARKSLSKALELLPEGGTLVVTKKAFIGGDYTLPAMSGELLITSRYGGVDYIESAGVGTNGISNNIFKMQAGATLTFQSDVTMDSMILYNEYTNANTLRVTNGATLTIGENVICLANPSLAETYMSIEVEAGSTVILNGGVFEDVTGEGTIINNGALIRSQIDLMVAYVAYNAGAGGEDTNTGRTPDDPRKTLSKTVTLLPDGGTVVMVSKIFIGGNYSVPKLDGTLTITSVYDGVDYTAREGLGNNRIPNNVLKMADGATLTFQSDTVLENLCLYNEYGHANTICVTNGATLTIGENVTCLTSAQYGQYMIVEVEEGATAILESGTFAEIRGAGRVINNGAQLLNHTHTSDGGRITTEPTCTRSGVITYTCTTCSETIGTERAPALGHSYALQTPEIQPTCTEAGATAVEACIRCGITRGGKVIAAKGHSSGSWQRTVAPTEFACGAETRFCRVCNAVLETRMVARLLTEREKATASLITCFLMTQKKSTCTVTFNGMGGSYTASVKVDYGKSLPAVAAPTKPGFVFVGWCTDCNGANLFDPTTAVEKDLKLFAKWERIG